MKFNYIPQLSNCLLLAFFSLSLDSMVFSKDEVSCRHSKRDNRCLDSRVECSKLKAEEERNTCYEMMEKLIAKMKKDKKKAEQHYEKRLKKAIEKQKKEYEEKKKREECEYIVRGLRGVSRVGLLPFVLPVIFIRSDPAIVARNFIISDEEDLLKALINLMGDEDNS